MHNLRVVFCTPQSHPAFRFTAYSLHNFKCANDLLEAGGVCKTLWPQKKQYERSKGNEKKQSHNNNDFSMGKQFTATRTCVHVQQKKNQAERKKYARYE